MNKYLENMAHQVFNLMINKFYYFLPSNFAQSAVQSAIFVLLYDKDKINQLLLSHII